MALKPRLESVDDLPDAIKAEYKKQADGTFLLDVTSEDGFELADTAGLRTSLQRERAAKTEALNKLKSFDGIEPDKAREALTTVSNLGDIKDLEDLDAKLAERQKQLEAKYEDDRKRLVSKHETDLAAATKTNETLTQQLHGELVNNAALSAITEHGGIPELLLPVVTRNVKVMQDEQSGKYVAKVLDADGQVQLSRKPGSSSDMTIPEYVENLRSNDVFARAFKGTEASGGGSNSPTNPRGGTGRGKHEISANDARDRQKWLAAQAAAEKDGQKVTIVD